MNSKSLLRFIPIALAFLTCLAGNPAWATVADGPFPKLGMSRVGGVLGGTAEYSWWYGCSPTAAGMVMGYYDRNGYGGLQYGNLVPGGVAEASTFPSTEGTWNYLAQYAIASPGHVSAFYRNGYGGSGDDIPSLHTGYDSLADFMGTSRDQFGNYNGATSFYYFTDGSRLYAKDSYAYNLQADGMYGIWKYLDYSGYGSHNAATDMNVFTQLTDNQGKAYGYTFNDFKAEIDAGREVIIHISGHSMVGYGYGDNNLVYVFDTWSPGVHTMTWGETYGSAAMWGVTSITPTGGSAIPLPPAVWLLGSGLIGLVGIRRKTRGMGKL